MKPRIDWLTQRVDTPPTSFGASRSEIAGLRIRMEWQKLKQKAAAGDEIWAFSNPSSSWRRNSKNIGYALVRDGVILESVIVRQE